MPRSSPATLALTPPTDPRFKPGAYITDGDTLYWVHRATATPMSLLAAKVLVLEDCRTNTVLELDLSRVETTCALIRSAPDP